MVKVPSLQSDHFAILTLIQNVSYSPEPHIPTFNNYKGNWPLFWKILNEADFWLVSTNSDINATDSKLKTIPLQSAKAAIPMTKLNFYKGSRRPKNWWNEECMVTVQAKRKTRKMFEKNPCLSAAISYK